MIVNMWFSSAATVGDSIDRLSHHCTASLLLFFATTIAANQYLGSPIQCWMPKEAKMEWEQYVESYCFAEGTYFVPPRQRIPTTISDREEAKMVYYAWIPIFLFLQAAAFQIPKWLATVLYSHLCLDLEEVMAAASKLVEMGDEYEDWKEELERQATYLEESLEMGETERKPLGISCIRKGKNLGSYMPLLYLLIKALYLLNAAFQFFILNHVWGIQTFIDLYSGREWTDSGAFPRVTYCDFEIREVGNIHRHTVQCVLKSNMLNEKIYLLLWLWLMVIAVVTAASFLYSVLLMLMRNTLLVKPVKRSLADWILQDEMPDEERDLCQQDIEEFCEKELRPGGVLLLKMVGDYAGERIAEVLMKKLFTRFEKRLAKEII